MFVTDRAPFRFEFAGKQGQDFVFALTGPAKRGLKVQQIEADCATWMMSESTNDGVKVAHTEHTLVVTIRRLADVIHFEEKFGATGLDIDTLLLEKETA
jgi:hypothetical protein